MKARTLAVVFGIAVVVGIAVGYPSLETESQSQDVPVNCVWCQMAVYVAEDEILSKITNETALEIEVLKGCTAFINATFCNKTVPGLVQTLWNYRHTSPKLVCELGKICPMSELLTSFESLPLLAAEADVKDVPVDCVWCQMAAYVAEELILKKLTNKTALEIELLKGCDAVINATFCNKTVPGLVNIIWSNRNASPKLICELSKICPSTELLTKGLLSSSVLDLSQLMSDKSTSCALCHGILDLAKTVAIDYEGKIESFVVNNFCDALPALPRQHCNAAVEEDIPKAVEGLNTSSICTRTAFC